MASVSGQYTIYVSLPAATSCELSSWLGLGCRDRVRDRVRLGSVREDHGHVLQPAYNGVGRVHDKPLCVARRLGTVPDIQHAALTVEQQQRAATAHAPTLGGDFPETRLSRQVIECDVKTPPGD